MLAIQSLHCESNGKNIISVDRFDHLSSQFSGIIGPNGAGKSSLLKTISGDLPYSGSITFHNRELTNWAALERARHLAVLPQSSQLNFPFKAIEVVALGLTPLSLSQKDARAQIRFEMKRTDCLHLAEKPYPQLSGGEKQRIHLARVLLQLCQATRPPLLLLDEPTSAQDLGQQHELLSLIQYLCTKQGYGALAILHDLNQVLRYCGQCYLLDNGQLKRQGTPEECLTTDNVALYWGYRPELLQLEHRKQCVII